MLKSIPSFKRGEYQQTYKKLSKENQKVIDEYGVYCCAKKKVSDEKILDMKRNVLKFKLVVGKDFIKTDLEDLRNYLSILNLSPLGDYTKNDMKVHIKKLLRWLFKDWSKRFDEFNDISQNTNPIRMRKFKDKILTKEEIEKLVRTETKMFWKAFLITQWEGAFRTKEIRFLKWSDLKEDGDYYSVELYATKTKKERPVVLNESKFYLDKLREEQENKNEKGVYIFHQTNDINKPVDKSTTSMWIKRLSKKALGRVIWSYCLRHTRATEYRRMVKEGQMSKDNALETLGHSEKMFEKTYSHLDIAEIKEMLKNQIYNFEDIPPERKHKLEEEIKLLKKEVELMNKGFINLLQNKKIVGAEAVKLFLKMKKGQLHPNIVPTP